MAEREMCISVEVQGLSRKKKRHFINKHPLITYSLITLSLSGTNQERSLHNFFKIYMLFNSK